MGGDIAGDVRDIAISPKSLLRHGDVAKSPCDVAQVAWGPPGLHVATLRRRAATL